jgi:hypothetical protein
MKEDEETTSKASGMEVEQSKRRIVRFLQWLRFWKRHTQTQYPQIRGILDDNPSDTHENTGHVAIADVTALLSEEELEAELDRILSDEEGIPQHLLQDETSSYSNQDIFVSKNFSVPFWKRVWRLLLLGRTHQQGRSPLASTKDATTSESSTTTEDHHHRYDISVILSRSFGTNDHFSVSTSKQKQQKQSQYSPLIEPLTLNSHGESEDSSVEVVYGTKFWPKHLYVPQTGKEMADSLRQYLEQQEEQQNMPRNHVKEQHPNTVDFDLIDPIDTKSLTSTALAVSFDNQDECAQLIFQTASTSDSILEIDQDSDLFDLPSSTVVSPPLVYRHPTIPQIPSVEKPASISIVGPNGSSNRHSDAHIDADTDYYKGVDPFTWSELEFVDPPLDILSPSSSSSSSLSADGEAAYVTDYENNMGWSYDDNIEQSTSFSSLLSIGQLFEPICGTAVARKMIE